MNDTMHQSRYSSVIFERAQRLREVDTFRHSVAGTLEGTVALCVALSQYDGGGLS